MSTPTSTIEAQPIPVQAKLAAGWTSFMFLYVYVDILAFYKPGVVDDILVGKVWEFDVTPTWAITALSLLAVPILMITLSVTLPARWNRVANLAVAAVQGPFALFNLAGAMGESWRFFYVLGVVLELALLALIVRLAWTWRPTPQTAAVPTPRVAGAR
ncbi:DUF6326 family protein [Nocardioides sp.]|uniref:DUF6326 family protein n=1 Tax=Nocardioides sp. TaxID=35761 RepID=UPI0035B03F42